MTLRMMHVLVNLEVGGAQKVALDLIDTLPNTTSAVAAVVAGGDYQSEFRQRGPTIVLGNDYGDPHRSYMWFWPPTIRRLVGAMRDFQPDVVQTHHYPAGIVGRTAARIAGVPVIIDTAHNTYYWKESRDLRIEAFLSRWTNCIVCVSAAVRDFAIRQNPRIPPDKFRLIYNGVDTTRYRFRGNGLAVRQRFELGPNDLVVGFVGRLVPQKKLEDLIDAAEAVVRRFSQARFLVIGEGPLGGRLEQEARRRGLANFFRFAGTVQDTENVYQTFDVLTQLASREGFGLSMAEAMASRVPVVAANARPIPEIVRHGCNGLIFEIGDLVGLVDAICTLLADASLRQKMGLQAERDMHRQFPLSATATNYYKLYCELLGRQEGGQRTI